MSNIETQVIQIKPELATHLLTHNLKNNRNLRPGVINKYATAMRNGEWHISEPLKFDVSGSLIDGQHRLSAVVKAGVPVDFVVLKNYPEESAQYVDIGAKRSVTDIAKLRGQDIKTYEMAITRALFVNNSEVVSGRNSVSENTLINIYNEYEKYVKFGAQLYANRKVYSAPVAGVFARALHYYEVQKPSTDNVQRLETAVTVLVTGVTHMDDNPLVLLRDYLMTEKRDRKYDRETKTYYTDYYLHLYMTRVRRKYFGLPKNYAIMYDIPCLKNVTNG